MPTKIRNVELLTLARSDAGTPVLGHVGVGIDANLIQDFEMGLSRVSSAAQFNLALNTEGATTNTAHFGGIAFTQGVSADTVMASIKAVNTSVDGYIDLSFNTRSVTNVLYIKADGKVGVKKIPTTYALEVDGDVQATNFRGAFIGNLTGNVTGTVSSLSNHDTDNLSEGSTNLYFTNERAQDAIGTMLSGNTETLITVTYDDSNNEIDFVVDNDLSNYSNTSSAFITLSSISVTDSGGDGSLAYNNSTGVITYTGPSASETRAHFSAGTGIGISSGEISIGQAVATGSNVVFNQVTAALVGNASTATTLETARNIVVGKSVAGAGDIDAITQSFNGGANISFDSELNSHLPADLRNTASTNIADEPSNTALKIIGSASKAVQLKINRQGLIVGYDEATITGGGGGGSSFDVTLNDEIYFDAAYTDQTTKTIDSSTTSFNLHFNSEALFTALTETTGTMSMTIGGTTKTLTLPDASFTQLDLDGSTLRATVGSTQRTVGLSSISVANATNATNADNIAISSENTNATRYLSFVNGTSGDRALKVDAGLIYNPSSNTLTTTTFSGALSGNATTSSGLLVGSTTYTPSSSATGGVSLVSRNSSNEVSIAKLILSDNTTSSNLDVIVGKISGSDLLREFSVGQVRSFIDPDNTRFLPTPTGGVYPLTVSNATSAGSATTAGSAVSISAGVGSQAFSGVTANGFVKLSGGDGTLSVGNLVSGDIPDNDANTSGKADTAGTADVADTVTFGSLDISASHANTESTLVVRGADKSVNIGALASTDITAQSLELTNASAALKVQKIMPRGSGSMLNWGTSGSGWPFDTPDGLPGADVNWYVKDNTQIGDYTSNTLGAFKYGYFGQVYSYDGFTEVSDSRLKENVEPLSLGLDFVRLLEPKKYTWKKSDTPRTKFGALAQDIEQVISELTEEESSLINIANYHENTEEQNEQALKGVSQSQVMWVLFNAVKQLDAKVQELEKQLDKS